jgi:hypothetical protein
MEHQEYRQYSSFEEVRGRLAKLSYQRGIIEEQVGHILAGIENSITKGREPALGAIELAHFKDKFYVIDGQHRLLALKRYYEKTGIGVPFHSIIYRVDNLEEMKELFLDRNRGIPLPDYMKKLDNSKRSLLLEIRDYLSANFDRFFVTTSKGARVNRPRKNIDIFIDDLDHSEIFHLINSIDDFETMLYMINDDLTEIVGGILDGSRHSVYGITKTMINGCKLVGGYFVVSLFPFTTIDTETYRDKLQTILTSKNTG